MRLEIEPATINDAGILFDWANDPLVRMNALNPEPILWEGHIQWLKVKLASADSKIYIASLDKEPIGQIRFDGENGSGYLIDYSIEKSYRGRGLGYYLVKESIDCHSKTLNKPCIYKAQVKIENIASSNVFAKLNFINEGITKFQNISLINYSLTIGR